MRSGIASAINQLSKSAFRAKFALTGGEASRLAEQDPASLSRQTRQIVTQRLAPAAPSNDGRQTPYRGHPVFVAQHATATCCRKCLARWHRIPSGRAMSELEVSFVVSLITSWLETRRGPSAQGVLQL